MDRLYTAFKFILDNDDDNANKINGVGFNKLDTIFAHSINQTPYERWSYKQKIAIYNLLRKYRFQLSTNGINYDDIPVPIFTQQAIKDFSSPKRMFKRGKELKITFSYDETLVANVKKIPNISWDKDKKEWSTIPSVVNVDKIIEFGIANDCKADKELLEELNNLLLLGNNNLEASKKDTSSLVIQLENGSLFPFQLAGVEYAIQNKKCLIADEPGLGKTLQALATVDYLNAYPCIVICPASVKYNWEREVQKWYSKRTVNVITSEEDKIREINIINYDMLKKFKHLLKNKASYIVDESHYVKSHSTLRSKNLKEILTGSNIRLFLTGTPILNRPDELINQLALLGRLEEFGGVMKFQRRYCDTSANLGELQEKLRRSCMVRRLKKDVLKELPEKQRMKILVDIDNGNEYNRAEDNLIQFVGELAKQNEEFLQSISHLTYSEQMQRLQSEGKRKSDLASRAEAIVRINTLRQLSAKGKIKQVIEWTENFLESGNKLLIFAYHEAIITALQKHFKCAKIVGGTSTIKRQEIVEKFQNDENEKLLVLNILAGGEGITLTKSFNSLFIEAYWNPGKMEQAEDRIHRISQTEKPFMWHMIGRNTIDEWMYALIEEKRWTIDESLSMSDYGEMKTFDTYLERLIQK